MYTNYDMFLFGFTVLGFTPYILPLCLRSIRIMYYLGNLSFLCSKATCLIPTSVLVRESYPMIPIPVRRSGPGVSTYYTHDDGVIVIPGCSSMLHGPVLPLATQ